MTTKGKILVADSEAKGLEFLVLFLSASGYEIVAARDGEQTLRLAKQERPALLLTDVPLATLDGFELAHEIRMDPVLASMPIHIGHRGDKLQGTLACPIRIPEIRVPDDIGPIPTRASKNKEVA